MTDKFVGVKPALEVDKLYLLETKGPVYDERPIIVVGRWLGPWGTGKVISDVWTLNLSTTQQDILDISIFELKGMDCIVTIEADESSEDYGIRVIGIADLTWCADSYEHVAKKVNGENDD